MERHSPLEWPAAEDLRVIAAELRVPYLLLLLELYTHLNPCLVSLADVDAFHAEPAARAVLAEWLANVEWKKEVA